MAIGGSSAKVLAVFLEGHLLASFLLYPVVWPYLSVFTPLNREAVKTHFPRRNGTMGDSKGISVASPIQDYLQNLHKKYAQVQAGAVASYIPELATANADWFWI
jgi:hypothetical protein